MVPSINDAGAKSRFFKQALKIYAPTLAGLQPGEHNRKLYDVARANGLDEAWESLKKDMARKKTNIYDKEDELHANTNSDVTQWLARYMAFQDEGTNELADSLSNAWDSIRGEYEVKYGSAPPSFTNDQVLLHNKADPNAKQSSKYESAYMRSQRASGQAEAKIGMGSVIEGLGVVGAGGQLGKGITRNVGGGIIDTLVDSDKRGDYVNQGPKSVSVATKTLRPQLAIAGGEDVRPTPEDNVQSNAIFEAFSWVPDGYGQGPHNRLHLQNKQNEQLRFGMEELSQPRRDEPFNPPHPMPRSFASSLSMKELEMEYARRIGMQMIESTAMNIQTRQPMDVLHNDYNLEAGSQDLPRQNNGPSPYQPIYDTYRQFLPARDPPALQMNALPMQDSYRGTWGYRRSNVFNSLLQ